MAGETTIKAVAHKQGMKPGGVTRALFVKTGDIGKR